MQESRIALLSRFAPKPAAANCVVKASMLTRHLYPRVPARETEQAARKGGLSCIRIYAQGTAQVVYGVALTVKLALLTSRIAPLLALITRIV